MTKRSIVEATALVILVIIGCSQTGTVPGTSGRNSAGVIEKTGHPPVAEGVRCYVCHKNDVSDNTYHEQFGKDCSQCHVKTTWMASKYPHEKWPLDKNHATRCTFCHTNLSAFDFSYQCWGCHHKEEETKKTHSALNINDLSDCIKCHKTTEKKKS